MEGDGSARFRFGGFDQRGRDTAPPPVRRDREPADVERFAVALAEHAADQAIVRLRDEARAIGKAGGKISLGFLQHAGGRVDDKRTEDAMREGAQFTRARDVHAAANREGLRSHVLRVILSENRFPLFGITR